jgi:hypothetical protein
MDRNPALTRAQPQILYTHGNMNERENTSSHKRTYYDYNTKFGAYIMFVVAQVSEQFAIR